MTLAAFVLLFCGSVMKGVLGLGLPMIAIPVLTLIGGLPKALAIVTIPVAAANLWQVWRFRHAVTGGRALLAFLATGALGTAGGTWLLASVDAAWLEATLGGIVILYLALRLAHPAFALSRAAGARVAPFTGLASGLLHGTTGISGPVSITYFHAMTLPRAEFIFCTGSMFLMFTLIQIPLLASAGILTGASALTGLLCLPAVALGLAAGGRIARHVKPAVFDKLVLAVLAFTAGSLLWRALPELLG